MSIRGAVVQFVSDAVRAGIDLLLPPRCPLCGGDAPGDGLSALLCATCQEALADRTSRACPRCGAGLSMAGERPTRGADVAAPAGVHGSNPPRNGREVSPTSCPRCRDRRLHFDSALSMGPYCDLRREAVLRMKRPSGESLARAVGTALADRLAAELQSFAGQWVVPVPMYWARRAMRGTNSPQVLAGAVAARLELPLVGVLARRRNTRPQPGLTPRQRFANVRGAFSIGAGYDLHERRVILVDDILTTGATSSEAARTLRKAGASAVLAVVVARAEGPGAG